MQDAPYRILVVCTANICRSVMAQHFLRRDADARGLSLEVSSCGILFDGESASDTVIEVLAERDLDATDHVSRKFRLDLLDGIDVVVTMERMHARELALVAKGARIHTLGALVEWLTAAAHAELSGTPTQRLAVFARGRSAGDLLGAGADEVDDPHGRSKRAHRRTADRLELMCAGLLDGLFGPVEPAVDEPVPDATG